jgi:hypothetical protein
MHPQTNRHSHLCDDASGFQNEITPLKKTHPLIAFTGGGVLQVLTFFIAPRFTRRSLMYEHDASVPVINEHVRSSGLTVAYNGDDVADPHAIQFKLANTGKRGVFSSTFDQSAPLRFAFEAKIVAILHASYQPANMPTPNVVFSDYSLSIGPSLIPRDAIIEYVLLVDGLCDQVVLYSNPLKDVDVEKRVSAARDKSTHPVSLRTVMVWAVVAFLVWGAIQKPDGAAHLANSIGSLLTSAATSLSHFVSSI